MFKAVLLFKDLLGLLGLQPRRAEQFTWKLLHEISGSYDIRCLTCRFAM